MLPYFHNPAKVLGAWRNNTLTLWVDGEFTRNILNKPAILQALSQEASARFGAANPRVSIVVGQPPSEELSPPAAPPAEDGPKDALDDLLAFGAQFDNIKIQ